MKVIADPPYPRAWRAENDDGLDVIYVHEMAREPARGWLALGEGVEGYLVRKPRPPIQHEIKQIVWCVTAAAILPAFLVRQAIAYYGLDFPRLAALFGVTQTILVRRVAEVKEIPCAIVGAHFVSRHQVWLSDAQLAAIVRRGGAPNWQVIRLTDAPAWVVWPKEW